MIYSDAENYETIVKLKSNYSKKLPEKRNKMSELPQIKKTSQIKPSITPRTDENLKFPDILRKPDTMEDTTNPAKIDKNISKIEVKTLFNFIELINLKKITINNHILRFQFF